MAKAAKAIGLRDSKDSKDPKGTEEDNELKLSILPGTQACKTMVFRQDMYSLLYVSLVKPQYKMYCDLVRKTGQELPVDIEDDKEDK